MATESPMRMVEGDGARNWSSSKDNAIFGSPLNNMAVEELGLLLKENRLRGDQTNMTPNRSGSAPPSMEGSFAAIKNLLAQQNPDLNSSLETLSSAIQRYESEEQLRSDPAYFTYYCSNVNLNPRLPPPLISQESRRLMHHIGGNGDSWRSSTLDDSSSGSGRPSRSFLSPHKEEPEGSPRQASDRWDEDEYALPVKNTGRHKSLVDMIQEDFPRTASPVFSQSHSSSSHVTGEETIDHDLHAVSSSISSLHLSKVPESNTSSVANASTLLSDGGHLVTLIPSTTRLAGRRDSSVPQEGDTSTKNSGLEDTASIYGALGSEINMMESRMRQNQEEQQPYRSYMPSLYPSAQQGIQHNVQGVQTQGMNQSYGLMENFIHSQSKFSSGEIQPSLPSSGLTPPLYATAAAYMASGNSFYPSFQPSGLYAPQYSMGGYSLGSALLPPYMAGYPPPGAIPIPYDGSSGSNYNIRATGISTGGNVPHGGDLQQLDKIYGQHGLMLQPSFMDPIQMQYFQHSFGDAYGSSVQHTRLASNATGGQAEPLLQKESTAFLGDQKLQPPTNWSLSMQNPKQVGAPGNNYYGGPPNMGVMTQFPASSVPNHLLPSPPVGGASHLARRNETRFPQVSSRNAGLYSGWPRQRVVNNIDDLKRHSFLEELKSTNARKFELPDIAGRIVEFSVDQHGSRFIQQKLERCSNEEKVSVFKEVLPHASKLMTDVFGNYVIQKFFEHGSTEQRKELADQLVGQMVPLSLQMYGCRVIQKALEVIEIDQKTELVHELDGHIMRCVRDQNGNHVIQKCIECIQTERIEFIISAFRGQVPTLSTHPYGCRVIQRVLEHCSDELQTQCIIDEIVESACLLAQDQYGNYVTQHVMESGKPRERSLIISKLSGKVVQMSQHKFASNVVEKCLEYADATEREVLIEEIIGQSDKNDNLLVMMKDQFANYVVQKVLEISKDKQREILLTRTRAHLHAMKKYTYGKHIVARFEQLFGVECEASQESGSS